MKNLELLPSNPVDGLFSIVFFLKTRKVFLQASDLPFRNSLFYTFVL
ncbi:hypothetical protein ADICYQ_0695 [Cyclobacterium qasimii M12-11B]|uniref:Uncharacterized protein n=1 Tax=Cyclobacterium qasimii M12-11B TaxID=641524 RepID=S7WWF4_9BACT|nr:hypothetical protein ADICYQ_0695 [Cyclobacterium qasimii M12-11B]